LSSRPVAPGYATVATNSFFAAALLGFFGLIGFVSSPLIALMQIVLCGCWLGYGFWVRSAPPGSRPLGFALGGVTIAVGAAALLLHAGYVAGTVIAIFVVIRLAQLPSQSAKDAFPYGQAPYGQAPNGQAPYAQSPAGQTPYGQPPPPPAPYWQPPVAQAPQGQAPYDQPAVNPYERPQT
jgi:hypothetical protein